MSKHDKIAEWIDKKFLQWENEEGTRKSLRQFSIYLDVDYVLFIKWRKKYLLPANDNVIKLANKLGEEIYEILNWEKPII